MQHRVSLGPASAQPRVNDFAEDPEVRIHARRAGTRADRHGRAPSAGGVLGPASDQRRASIGSGFREQRGPARVFGQVASESPDNPETPRSLYPGGLSRAPRISARLEGVPSRVVGSPSLRVSRREIRMTCDEGVQTFRYREGVGSHSFLWSPDCTEVSLRIWALDQESREVELLPQREWTGPLALPDFLHQAQRRPGKRFQWTLRYQEPQVEVVVEYRLRGGDGILAIQHTSPPTSMRN